MPQKVRDGKLSVANHSTTKRHQRISLIHAGETHFVHPVTIGNTRLQKLFAEPVNIRDVW